MKRILYSKSRTAWIRLYILIILKYSHDGNLSRKLEILFISIVYDIKVMQNRADIFLHLLFNNDKLINKYVGVL